MISGEVIVLKRFKITKKEPLKKTGLSPLIHGHIRDV
jgi:hypothetical protein